ncbi:hypothetical protein AVEN_157278-1, partial [Araneus ventricosus]
MTGRHLNWYPLYKLPDHTRTPSILVDSKPYRGVAGSGVWASRQQDDLWPL